jgi:hypothetical protein
MEGRIALLMEKNWAVKLEFWKEPNSEKVTLQPTALWKEPHLAAVLVAWWVH